MLFEQGALQKRWREHFTQLLNRPRKTVHQQDSPTKEEIARAIKHLKSHKEAGPDKKRRNGKRKLGMRNYA